MQVLQRTQQSINFLITNYTSLFKSNPLYIKTTQKRIYVHVKWTCGKRVSTFRNKTDTAKGFSIKIKKKARDWSWQQFPCLSKKQKLLSSLHSHGGFGNFTQQSTSPSMKRDKITLQEASIGKCSSTEVFASSLLRKETNKHSIGKC